MNINLFECLLLTLNFNYFAPCHVLSYPEFSYVHDACVFHKRLFVGGAIVWEMKTQQRCVFGR